MHQGRDKFKLNFSIQGPGNDKLIKILTPIQPTVVKTAEKKIIIFFKFPKHLLQQGTRKVMVEAIDEKLQLVVASREVTLVGPVD